MQISEDSISEDFSLYIYIHFLPVVPRIQITFFMYSYLYALLQTKSCPHVVANGWMTLLVIQQFYRQNNTPIGPRMWECVRQYVATTACEPTLRIECHTGRMNYL